MTIYYITRYFYMNPLYKVILFLTLFLILKSTSEFSFVADCMNETSTDSTFLPKPKRVSFDIPEEMEYARYLRTELNEHKQIIADLERDNAFYRQKIRNLQLALFDERSTMHHFCFSLEKQGIKLIYDEDNKR